MFLKIKQLCFCVCFLCSCNYENLKIISSLPNSLNEVSGAEIITNSDLIWVIEDSGNKNHIYGLNAKGAIVKDIVVENAKNIDWEDLTSDNKGNIYIGDFGNNNNKRNTFTIYKISDLKSRKTTADSITFTLPNDIKKQDFEAFFILKNHFYIFNKSDKKNIVIKVLNQPGTHIAEFLTSFNLKGKNTKITAADLSANAKTIILLNHEKIWKITNFNSDDFFSGNIEKINLGHNSQKESVCFKTNSQLILTDERKGKKHGNIYTFNLD